MSMSTHVIGIVPVDAKFRKMWDLRETCIEAGVSLPKEVSEFFRGPDGYDKECDESGMHMEIEKLPCVKEHNAESEQGYEIDIRELPEDVKIIRVYNSY